MITPQIPENEGLRLRGLRGLSILDTPPEERFDVVTRLAKQVFRVEMAVVSLVDEDRQWFKSRCGLDATETPRAISFCGHAINETDVMIVEDATVDPRFHDNPLVVGAPFVRFYAGCPLSANGVIVGTLCIIDPNPRQLLDPEIALLRDLSALVERELETVELAALDEATGLVNRRGLRVTGNQLLAIGEDTNRPVSLLFFDLDGFKQINDQFGHQAGDEALAAFSQCLKDAFRSSDVVARLGGDEFCVLITNEPTSMLARPLKLLAELVETHNAGVDSGLAIRYSVGTAAYDPEKHHSFADLLDEADEAMYLEKRRGRRSAA